MLSFISKDFADQHSLVFKPTRKPNITIMADGRRNIDGFMTHFTVLRLNIDQHTEVWNFIVGKTSWPRHLFRIDWLRHHIPLLLGAPEESPSCRVLRRVDELIPF